MPGAWARLLGRRPPDPTVEAAWQAFVRASSALDGGMRALLATVPTARSAGVDLHAGIHGFHAGLEAARTEIPNWAPPALQAELGESAQAAQAALDSAAHLAASLPERTRGLEFEHRNELLDEVLDELHAWREAETRLRALRRRRAPKPATRPDRT